MAGEDDDKKQAKTRRASSTSVGFSMGVGRDTVPVSEREDESSTAPAPTAQRQNPVNFFTQFKKSIDASNSSPRDRSDEILMTFGMALGSQRGRKPDPNFATPMQNGRSQLSDIVLNAYATAGQEPSEALVGMLEDLDELSESANALAQMDPRVRTRLQGSTAAASLSVIRQRENELKRAIMAEARDVVTEGDQLKRENNRIAVANAQDARLAAKRTAEMQAIDAERKGRLDQFDYDQLIAYRVAGALPEELADINPAYLDEYLAERGEEVEAVDDYAREMAGRVMVGIEGLGSVAMQQEEVVASIADRYTAEDITAIREAAVDPETGQVPFEVQLPDGRTVPYQTLIDAQAKADGVVADLAQHPAKSRPEFQERLARRLKIGNDKLVTSMSRFGTLGQALNIDQKTLSSSGSGQALQQAVLQRRAKLEAASGLATPDDVMLAIEEAETEFTETLDGIFNDMITEGVPESLQPAMLELARNGTIRSFEAAASIMNDRLETPSLDYDIRSNPGLDEAVSLVDALIGSSLLPQDDGGDGYSIPELVSGGGKPNAKEQLAKDPIVQLMSQPMAREWVSQAFRGQTLGLAISTRVGVALADLKAQYQITETSSPEEVEAGLRAMEGIDLVSTRLLGGVDIDPALADMSNGHEALYQRQQLRYLDADGREQTVLDANGNPVIVEVISPRFALANLAAATGVLKEAGIAEADLVALIAEAPTDGLIESVVERVKPRGLAQHAMFRMLMDGRPTGLTHPNDYTRQMTESFYAAFTRDYADEIRAAADTELADIVTEDVIAAGRQRWVMERVNRGGFTSFISGGVGLGPSSASMNIQRLQDEAANLSKEELILGGYISTGDMVDIFDNELPR